MGEIGRLRSKPVGVGFPSSLSTTDTTGLRRGVPAGDGGADVGALVDEIAPLGAAPQTPKGKDIKI